MRHPGGLRNIGNAIHPVRPRGTRVACELHVAVVGAHPNDSPFYGTRRDAHDRRVVLGSGSVQGQSPALERALLLGVVRRQVR